MNIITFNGKFLVDSREVAEMTDKRHDHLIRDIEGYKAILDQSPNLGADQFFIESNYEAGTGKPYRCYLLTRKGCDMVANKMTGEKGVLFTAAYVTKFEEMERSTNNLLAGASPELRAILMVDRKTQEIESRVNIVEQKLDEQITLDHGEARRLQKAVAKRVYDIAESVEQRPELFRELHREIKDRWGVPSYHDVKRHEFADVIKYIEAWRPRLKSA